MSRPFTFIHAADLHIASPFQGLAGDCEAIGSQLRASTFAVYRALIDLCLDRNRAVDFLVVAGDVFDARDRSLRAQLAFRDGLERLSKAGIESFVVHGNHDPLDGRIATLTWPEHTHVFDAAVESVEAHAGGEPVAVVSGVSFPTAKVTSNLAMRFHKLSVDLFHIGLLHCNVGAQTGHEPYAPCELHDLTRAKVDYWALGHVHTYKVLSRSPWIVYPGNTQARSFRETGPRGCCVVTVDEGGEVAVEPVHLDAVRLAEPLVDISGFTAIDQLQAAIVEAVAGKAQEAAGRPLLCRARLTGRGQLAQELGRVGAVDDLVEALRDRLEGESPPVWLNSVIPGCRPEVDLEERRQGGDLVAEVLTVADEELRGSTETEGLTHAALQELLNHHRARRAVSPPEGDELDELLRAASLLCVELLEGGP